MLLRILASSGGPSADDASQWAPVPAWRDVLAGDPEVADQQERCFEVDASPWGAGGLLRVRGKATEYFTTVWRQEDCPDASICIGSSSAQSYFEALALLQAADLWCTAGTRPTPALGDNLSALEAALNLKGRGPVLCIAQMLAVLRARRTVDIPVGHLPSEANVEADALSRLSAPGDDRKPFPASLHGGRGMRLRISKHLPGLMATYLL